jgi:hypothetical protein
VFVQGRVRTRWWYVALRGLLRCGVLSWWLAAPPVHAEPLPIKLVWNAPPNCPDRAFVVASIDRLTGNVSAKATSAELWVEADIVPHEDTFTLRLSWRSAGVQSQRTMASPNCTELARAAALVVALAAAPENAEAAQAVPEPETAAEDGKSSERGESSESGESNEPAKLQGPRPAEPARSLPTPFSRTERESREVVEPRQGVGSAWQLRGLLAVESGALPDAGPGMVFGAGASHGILAASLDVALFAPQRTTLPAGGGEFWFGSVALHPCIATFLAFARIFPCLALDLAAIHGEGQHVELSRGGFAWFPRFGGGVEFNYEASKHVAFVAGGWLLAAPWRPRFVVGKSELVHEPVAWEGRWTTGLELRL